MLSLKVLSARVGGLSEPSKMPCFGSSLPAQACKTGSKLAKAEGTVCSGCYALRGNYTFPSVKKALAKRLEAVKGCEFNPGARVEWIDAMVDLLNIRRDKWKPSDANDARFFRWHDSGDLQGEFHLSMINAVAARTARVAHWLPTRETKMVKSYLDSYGEFEPNLTVRLSGTLIGAKPPTLKGTVSSGVHLNVGAPESGAQECPAYHNNNACGSCRLCWFSKETISYLKH